PTMQTAQWTPRKAAIARKLIDAHNDPLKHRIGVGVAWQWIVRSTHIEIIIRCLDRAIVLNYRSCRGVGQANHRHQIFGIMAMWYQLTDQDTFTNQAVYPVGAPGVVNVESGAIQIAIHRDSLQQEPIVDVFPTAHVKRVCHALNDTISD